MSEIKQGIFMREIKADASEVVISIVGVIGWDIAYAQMREMFKAIPDTIQRVIFEIYSPGGSVWEGNGIIQDIGAMKQHTVARVQVAASMATLIAVACKEREIAANGRFLIHNPWAELAGDAATLEKRAKELRDCEMEAANFYAARAGQKVEAMIDLMDEERWLTPKETLDLGFVQKINDPFDQAAYAAVKSEIVAAGKWPVALVEIPKEEIKMESKETPKPEEKKDANANSTGSEVKADAKPIESAKPADAEKTPGDYERGKAEGRAESEIEHAKQIAERDKLVSKHQSAKDLSEAKIKEIEKKSAEALSARESELMAKINDLTKCLKDAQEQNHKFLAGGMSFTPTVETWEEAMQLCKGDYAVAAKTYPKLRDEYNERKRQRK
jgi:ATP-dependent protease ClpP protease subunit